MHIFVEPVTYVAMYVYVYVGIVAKIKNYFIGA